MFPITNRQSPKPTSLLNVSQRNVKRKREQETNVPQRNVKRRIDQSNTTLNKKKRLKITFKRPSNSNSNSDIEILHTSPSYTSPSNSNSNTITNPVITPPPKPPEPIDPLPLSLSSQTEKHSNNATHTLINVYSATKTEVVATVQWEEHREQKSVGIDGNKMRKNESKTLSKTVTKKKKRKRNQNNNNTEHNYRRYDLINDLNCGAMHNKKRISKEVNKKPKYQCRLGSVSSTESIGPITLPSSIDINANQGNTLQERIHKLEQECNRYKRKYKEMKECAKQLYTECVDGEQPRWHLIEFIDTENRVTRDSELAELRTQISSLYPKGSFEVCAVDKWVGRSDIEESVLSFVKLNGDYRIKPYILLGLSKIVPVDEVLRKYLIVNHPRISALNGQCGVKAMVDIPKGTCVGQYFGAEILQKAFGKVFDGTGEEHDHNIYAFDQTIDPNEIKKVRKKRIAMDRKKQNNDDDVCLRPPVNDDLDIDAKVFIIDPFIGNWKGDELMLRYVNDCRSNIGKAKPDFPYYNVEYVGMKVNGWPQTYLISRKHIKANESLMTYYGTPFCKAINTKRIEQEKKKNRKQRIDRDILKHGSIRL